MSIQTNIVNNSVKLLSGLANNDSIVPMLAKDTLQNSAIVYTYHKEGTPDDTRERFIEEFGTGAVWLLGIPAIKKIIDKTVYPALKLDANFDIRNLSDEKLLKEKKDLLKDSNNPALAHEKEIFGSLDNVNEVLKNNKFLKKFNLQTTNKSLYKYLFGAKFIASTALAGVLLSKIIKYKQKTTQERIERDYYQNSASEVLIKQNIQKNPNFGKINNKENSKNVPFKGVKGLAQLLMYNPVANTFLLDLEISGLRLKDARKGEYREIGCKELFQYVFIYMLAKPIQLAFEKIGKLVNAPIELDPKVLFDKDAKNKISSAAKTIKDNNLIIETVDKNGNTTKTLNQNYLKEINKIAKNDIENPLIDVLENNGLINTIKDKKGNKQAISNLNFVKDSDAFDTFKSIASLGEDKNLKNLGNARALKVVAVLGNIAIAALATGILQPKINIWMRKLFNNGDNRNPAIIAAEQEMKAKKSEENQTSMKSF